MPGDDEPAMLDLNDLASEGILVLGGADRITQANRRAHELMQGVVASLEGADFWEVLPEQLAQEHHGHASRALQSGRTYTFLDHDEFAGRWVEYVVSRQSGVTLVHMRNVSDRHRLMGLMRESERRSQGLFESNPNILWVFEIASLQILAVNRAAVRFYGYAREDFLAMAANKLYPDSDARELRNSLPSMDPNYAAAAAVNGATAARLCKQRKRDGNVQMVELSGLPVEWSGKRALLVTVSDVTARYLADAQLRQENAELEDRLKERTRALQDALRELGALQYAMSHDLQSPLHAVDGFTKVMIDQYGDQVGEKGLHYLRRIKAGTEKMARLIEDLRMLTRISRLSMNPQVFDVGAACTAIVEALRKREPAREVELELEPGMRLLADPELMTTALTAMIDNAWKFTSRKAQGWIKVGLALGKSADEKVLFVSDNGAGYDPAYASKLFTAFQRLHSSADFPGAGLGLVMVQRVAMRHGGQAWSESIDGSGATFYLSLPQENTRRKAEREEAVSSDAALRTPTAPAPQAAKR